MTFRDRIIAAAAQRGWGMAELSRQAGVSYNVVRELHRRPDSTTSAENAAKLARALGLAWPEVAPPAVIRRWRLG